MSKFRSLLYCTATLSFIQLVAAGTSHAVPAFSRAHKVECTTCHTIYPELNEYGEAFQKNSYVYVGKGAKGTPKAAPAHVAAPAAAPTSQPAGDTPVVKGDGDTIKLSRLKAGAMGASTSNQTTAPIAPPPAVTAAPAATETTDGQAEGMLLAGIPELLPISFTGSINYFTGDRRNMGAGGNDVDFAARSFKIHAAGNFRDKVGFFATYVAYSEQDSGSTGITNTSESLSNNKTDINEFFLQWRQALGTPVNVKIGRFQPKLGLWKTNNKLSVTNNYLPYTYTVGPKSQFRTEQTQDAIEINSVLGKRFYGAAGIVNRRGQNEKEGYGHASYKIGGADYMGNEPDVDLNKEESILDFLTMTTGAYGYYGENGLYNAPSSARNNYFRAGLDAEILYKIYRLRLLGSYGEDDNVFLNDNPWRKVISKAATIEGEVTLLTNLITAARFEYLQREGWAGYTDNYVRRYVASLGYAPLENLKLSAEFKYEVNSNADLDSSNNAIPHTINRIGTIGATFSF